MFFDRFGKTIPTPAMIRTRRRQWAALGLAVAMATPPGALQFARANSGEARPGPGDSAGPATQPAQTPSDKSALIDAIASMTPRQHYQLARELYRHNDWAHAREHFEAAKAGRYRPGLFEGDSPATYLTRMDRKEQADREAAAQKEQLDRELAARKEQADREVAARAIKVRPLALAEQAATADAPTTAPDNSVPAPKVAPAPEAPAPPPAAPVPQAVPPTNAQALQDLRATADAEELRKQQAAYQANQLVEQAQAARQNNELDHARDLYTRATLLDPSNRQARAGLDEILTLQGRNTHESDLLSRQARTNQATIDEITYRFNTSIGDARDAIAQGKFQEARAAVTRAQVAADSNRNVFTPQALRQFDDTIKSTQLQISQAEEAYKLRAEATNNVEQQRRIQEEQARAADQVRKTVEDLKATARQLTEQRRYKEASGVVEQILVLDPNNEYAIGVKPLLEDRYQFNQQRGFMEQRERIVTHLLNDAEEKLIPYDDIMRYPADWPDISQTREQTVSAERGENKEDRAVQAQLDRPLPELQFDGVGFSDVVDFLRDVSGANIFVNWKSLEGAGIDRNAPVTARLRNVKFSKALQIILDSLGGGNKLSYTVDDGVITISTSEDLSKNTITRVYDIRDLIIAVPDFDNAPDFSLNSTSNNTSQNPSGAQQGGLASGGGAGGSLFGGGGGGGGGGGAEKGQSRQELVDQIVKLITETVAPDSWRDAGGTVGAIRELSGQLIVTQTPENQRQLVALLEQLRETRAIQVTIETRFLTVNRNFLNDIGVDLNFLFNANANISKNFGSLTNGVFSNQIPLTAANSTFTSNIVTPVPGSLGGTVPPGVSTNITFLDDFQVNLILKATEASQNSIVVDAPRVTLFNGQRAYVLVSDQQAYVSNLTASVGTGVSSFTPTISIVESGVILDVSATVSADRKYVTLTLRPQLSRLKALQSFSFQQAASAANSTVGTGNTATSTAAIPTTTIQLPLITIQEVKTTVSVPDGGTLLLGGETFAGETSREEGVPILSKIPFLKRLFTNRNFAKDEQILLILVRPTILIQREIEQKQFPLLTSKLSG